MRTLILSLVFMIPVGLAAQTGPAQEARAAAEMLDTARQNMQEAQTERDRVAAVTQAIGAFEKGLGTLRRSLLRAAARETELAAKLHAENTEIAALLAVLMQVGDGMTPAILLHPAGPTGTARAGMLLADTAPALNARAAGLRRDLAELQDIRLLQDTAQSQLEAGLVALQEARAALHQAIADRGSLPKRFIADPIREAILVSSIETLDAFAAGIDQISSGEALASTVSLDVEKGRLDLPVQGRLRHAAGQADAAGITRPGMIVATAPGALVTSPVAATLRYAGPLLDFGNVVILEPALDVLFVFAGIGTIYAETGDLIEAGSPLGLMGGGGDKNDPTLSTDGDDTGAARSEALYIEVRANNGTQDPSLWFRTDKNG